MHQCKPAVLAELEALPESVVGEIIDGTLYTQARPSRAHHHAVAAIALSLYSVQAPRGPWWLHAEPMLAINAGSPRIRPDLAGWLRSRVPSIERGIQVQPPDWICEVMTTGARHYDRRIKAPLYAQIGVAHLWLVDADEPRVYVYRSADNAWQQIGEYDITAGRALIPPFAEPLDVGRWFP